MGIDWVVLAVVILFILLDTGLIIAFIKQCEEHEIELLRDIYEETHPKKVAKVVDDVSSIFIDKEDESDENELMCLSCKYGNNQTVLRCKYCDFSTNWINFEPRED